MFATTTTTTPPRLEVNEEQRKTFMSRELKSVNRLRLSHVDHSVTKKCLLNGFNPFLRLKVPLKKTKLCSCLFIMSVNEMRN